MMKTLLLVMLMGLGLGGISQREAVADEAAPPVSPPVSPAVSPPVSPPVSLPFATADELTPPDPASPPSPTKAPALPAAKPRVAEKLGTSPPGATPPLGVSKPVRRTREGAWYGPYALGADVAFALSAAALIGSDKKGAPIPLVSLVFSGPLVHVYHHRPGSAGMSLLLRAGLPLTLGLLAVGGNDGCGECDGPDFSGVGKAAATGLALGVMIDWLLLPHREQIENDGDVPLPHRRKRHRRATVVPLVSAERHGAMFGAAASF